MTLAGALVWFRRDLRADDNAALFHALKAARQVWCVFVLDTTLLKGLPSADRRVEFIRDSLLDLDAQLRELGLAHGVSGVGLIVRHGEPGQTLAELARTLGVQAVYANHDDEPAALSRDARVRGLLAEIGVALHTSKDHVVFERSELLTATGSPYSVFTPYKNAWLRKVDAFYLKAYPVDRHARALAASALAQGVPTLAAIGFQATNLHQLRLPTGSAGGQGQKTNSMALMMPGAPSDTSSGRRFRTSRKAVADSASSLEPAIMCNSTRRPSTAQPQAAPTD